MSERSILVSKCDVAVLTRVLRNQRPVGSERGRLVGRAGIEIGRLVGRETAGIDGRIVERSGMERGRLVGRAVGIALPRMLLQNTTWSDIRTGCV